MNAIHKKFPWIAKLAAEKKAEREASAEYKQKLAEKAYWKAQEAGKRMLEVEEDILHDIKLAGIYLAMFIKGRWPAMEKIIMEKEPLASTMYHYCILAGERWPEVEPIIAQDDNVSENYSKHFKLFRLPLPYDGRFFI